MPFASFGKVWHRTLSAAALAIALAVSINAAGQVQYKVLYSFCSAANCADGRNPYGKLVFDSKGNLYGTTAAGGVYGEGTAFELIPSGSNWEEVVLYNFCLNDVRNCPNGDTPLAGLTFDNAGNLYGTTQYGGTYGEGTAFELSPPSSQGGQWTENVLWSFGAQGDGRYPVSHLIFDASENLYGTTSGQGPYGGGLVFQLVPVSGGQWSENILFSFGQDPFNGYQPEAGLTFDKLGNLYGTTLEGGTKDGFGWGVVYKLSPKSQLPWTETVLFRFAKKIGANPRSTVNFDNVGNLYGTLSSWGPSGGGGVFRLTPQGHEYTSLFGGVPDGSAPLAGVLIHGNALYGTTTIGGSQDAGSIFKMQSTVRTLLYSFCSLGGCADGKLPGGGALILRGKSLFGTATDGGANGQGGVVFQISEAAR